MPGDELLQHLPCALVRFDDRGRIVGANPVACELLGVAAPDGGGGAHAWDELGWLAEAPFPGGSPVWRRAQVHGEARLLQLGPTSGSEGWCLLEDRTTEARLLDRVARGERLAALQPVVGGVVHAMNNLLHLAMTLADLHGGMPDAESTALARRVIEMCRHSATVLGAVRAMSRAEALPWRLLRVDDLVAASVALHRKMAELAGVRIEVVPRAADRQVVVGPQPDLAAVLSQLFVHAVATAGPDRRIEVTTGADRGDAGARVAIELRLDGSPELDEGLATILAEPSRSLGFHEASGFAGDVVSLGPSLLAVRLAGGDLEVGVDGGRRRLRITMPAGRGR